jgi:hypothetical protein
MRAAKKTKKGMQRRLESWEAIPGAMTRSDTKISGNNTFKRPGSQNRKKCGTGHIGMNY